MNKSLPIGHAERAVRRDFRGEDLADHIAVGVEDLNPIASGYVEVAVGVASETVGHSGFNVGEHCRVDDRCAAGRDVEAHDTVIAELAMSPASISDV